MKPESGGALATPSSEPLCREHQAESGCLLFRGLSVCTARVLSPMPGNPEAKTIPLMRLSAVPLLYCRASAGMSLETFGLLSAACFPATRPVHAKERSKPLNFRSFAKMRAYLAMRNDHAQES